MRKYTSSKNAKKLCWFRLVSFCRQVYILEEDIAATNVIFLDLIELTIEFALDPTIERPRLCLTESENPDSSMNIIVSWIASRSRKLRTYLWNIRMDNNQYLLVSFLYVSFTIPLNRDQWYSFQSIMKTIERSLNSLPRYVNRELMINHFNNWV